MAFIVLEGLDRVGKSTVAKVFEAKGYEYIHFSAPDKKYTKPGYTGPSYFDDLVEQLISLSGRNVIFDRSWYGETIWPYVYGRKPQISEEELELIKEIEDQNDTTRILLHDPETEKHWRRCVENNEPLSRSQFNSAVQMFYSVAEKYAFEVATMEEVLNADQGTETSSDRKEIQPTSEPVAKTQENPSQRNGHGNDGSHVPSPNQTKNSTAVNKVLAPITPQQTTLMQANAINDVLGNRIIKKRGEHYEVLESRVRVFLNDELGKLLGLSKPAESASPVQQQQQSQFSKEEVIFIKTLIKNARKTK